MGKTQRMKKLCPGHSFFFEPTLKALYNLGGSGSNEEIYKQVIPLTDLSEKVINEMHSFTMSEVEYKLMWARTYLKNYGAVESSKHEELSKVLWRKFGNTSMDGYC